MKESVEHLILKLDGIAPETGIVSETCPGKKTLLQRLFYT